MYIISNQDIIVVFSSAKTLQISYIGMQTQEVVIKPNLKVVLKSDSQKLDEVVVTAMGIKRSEKSLGYSVTSVKGDEITKARESNVLNSDMPFFRVFQNIHKVTARIISIGQ